MTRFCAFCHSPYFVKHEQVRALVAYFSEVYPQFDARRCDKRLLFKRLFGGGAYDKGKLALIFTYTQRALEQFIAQEQYQEDDSEKQYRYLQGLQHLAQFNTFEKAIKNIEGRHLSSSRQDARFFYQAYRLAKSADDYYNQQDRRRMDNSLVEKQRYLDRFFMLEKLQDACEARVRQRILRVDYRTRFLDAVLKEIANDPDDFADSPAVLVYYRIYRMLEDEEDRKRYQEAFQFFSVHTGLFGKEEKISLYIYFMNYCIARINQGDNDFLSEIFQIYQAQLDQKLLLENGELSEWDYKNIVTTALRLGELDWAMDFMEGYRDLLPTAARENAYRFNLANYHYARGDYGKVLDLLIRVEYSDLRYNLSAKALLLRTYFDLEEYEALYSLTESFKQYLLRNKLMSETRRAGFNNLFKLARKLANLKARSEYLALEKREKELQKIDRELSEADLVFNREWLSEKVEQFRARYLRSV